MKRAADQKRSRPLQFALGLYSSPDGCNTSSPCFSFLPPNAFRFGFAVLTKLIIGVQGGFMMELASPSANEIPVFFEFIELCNSET